SLALAGCQRSPAPEPILIGHIAPFDGPDKIIGEHAKQAILMAVEEVNKEENRILGRRIGVLHPSYPAEDLKNLQPLAVRLLTVDKAVALVGGRDLDQARSLGRTAQAYESPVVTPTELPIEPLGENIFSVNVGLSFEGQALARFAAKDLNAQSVVVLMDERSQ